MPRPPDPLVGDGLLLLDKPSGMSSHDVVGACRRICGTRKVGHAGTLDPMATGLLLVGVNKATRLLTFLVGADKSYTATIRLGVATVTDDAEGETLAVADAGAARDLSEERIAAAIAALTGAIEQIPSAVSAIKVNGVRSYARVRDGEEVALAARPVRVDRFDVLARRDGPYVDLDVAVDVSSGTYVRALARDLGAALGVGGHLTALRRTRVGGADQRSATGVVGVFSQYFDAPGGEPAAHSRTSTPASRPATSAMSPRRARSSTGSSLSNTVNRSPPAMAARTASGSSYSPRAEGLIERA